MTALIIAIDGPAASGKGTVAKGVAQALGFHYLESGSLYRLVGFVALRSALPLDDEDPLAAAAAGLNVRFDGDVIRLDGEDVAAALRHEAVGKAAGKGLRNAPGEILDGYRHAPRLARDTEIARHRQREEPQARPDAVGRGGDETARNDQDQQRHGD